MIVDTKTIKISEFQKSREIIEKFTSQQIQLIEALKISFPNFSDLDRLIGFPQRSGILEVEGAGWTFQKHGVGFTFTKEKGKAIVNFHKYLSNPDYFDACRIASYLASIHWKGEKNTSAAERQLLYTEKGAKEWLNQLASLGVIEPISDDKTHYKLVA
jgi:hypothetical protein